MKKAIIATLLLVPLAGCSDSGPTLSNRAKYLCSQCHALPFPDLHSSAEWPGVVARMLGHMQTNNRPMPDAKEQAEILKYYQTKAGR
jgi:hypothetical protein